MSEIRSSIWWTNRMYDGQRLLRYLEKHLCFLHHYPSDTGTLRR